MSEQITVTDGFIRLMPPTMPMTAAFMTIKNNSSKEVKITSVSSNLAVFTEMHTHKKKDDGTAVMMQMESLSIKANSSAVLQRGGDHIMYMRLEHKLKIGDIYTLTLNFSDGSQFETQLKIKRI